MRHHREKLRAAATLLFSQPEPSAVEALRRAYAYTQARLESIGYHGWAHDYDGEIDYALRAAGGRGGMSVLGRCWMDDDGRHVWHEAHLRKRKDYCAQCCLGPIGAHKTDM